MSKNPPPIEWPLEIDYRKLVGERDWNRLHPDIQKRFSLANAHRCVTYGGVMYEVYLSFAGRLLAQLCRLIGTPLALYSERNVAMEVRVYPDRKLQGMTWDRFYYYAGKKLNRVRSTKCILPKAGMVEIVGFGFGMHLTVYEENQAIVFESKRFFWQLGGLKISIPSLLTPGKTIVKQQALNAGRFRFSLQVDHALLGRVFYQVGDFSEI
jgi:hypothetical protein